MSKAHVVKDDPVVHQGVFLQVVDMANHEWVFEMVEGILCFSATAFTCNNNGVLFKRGKGIVVYVEHVVGRNIRSCEFLVEHINNLCVVDDVIPCFVFFNDGYGCSHCWLFQSKFVDCVAFCGSLVSSRFWFAPFKYIVSFSSCFLLFAVVDSLLLCPMTSF